MSAMAMAVPKGGQPQVIDLRLDAAGLCCSVGYHLDAAVCALRANMDHFRESDFCAQASEPIRVASMPDTLFGEERLQRWVEFAVRDCAHHMNDVLCLLDTERTAVIVLAPEASRSHADKLVYARLAKYALSQLSGANSAASTEHLIRVVSTDRTGLGEALLHAAHLLSAGQTSQVLLIGVDSYLNAGDINSCLDAGRLFVAGNTDGFLPGEAAAAILLRSGTVDAAGCHIRGVGLAEESGCPDGRIPSRAQGLTTAIRAACEQAGVDPMALNFRLSDQNGEQFFAREAANAITRVMFGGQKLAHLTLADKIGEVGAATGVAMLAWLLRDMGNADYSPGNLGLIHLANDNGMRCAVVIAHQGER